MHTDQLILIFNTILSEHVMNGNIDLVGSSSVYQPELSTDEEATDGENELADILNPNKLLEFLE